MGPERIINTVSIIVARGDKIYFILVRSRKYKLELNQNLSEIGPEGRVYGIRLPYTCIGF